MEINVDKLKEMQNQENKRRKRINRVTLIIGIIMLVAFGYFFTQQATDYPTWKLIVGLVVGMLFIVLVLLMLVFFVFNYKSRKFVKALDKVVAENNETSGPAYYQALKNMDPQPQTFDEYVYWFFNLSTALYRSEQYQKGLEIVIALQEAMDPQHPMQALYADQEKYLREKV